MSFVEYLRIPDATTVELMTVPALFLALLILSLLAGFRWHAALIVTGIALAICVMGLAARQDIYTSETKIGMAVAGLLLVVFWKLRARRRA
jgi:high-affinity Fe2+/Pb2+ permease